MKVTAVVLFRCTEIKSVNPYSYYKHKKKDLSNLYVCALLLLSPFICNLENWCHSFLIAEMTDLEQLFKRTAITEVLPGPPEVEKDILEETLQFLELETSFSFIEEAHLLLANSSLKTRCCLETEMQVKCCSLHLVPKVVCIKDQSKI